MVEIAGKRWGGRLLGLMPRPHRTSPTQRCHIAIAIAAIASTTCSHVRIRIIVLLGVTTFIPNAELTVATAVSVASVNRDRIAREPDKSLYLLSEVGSQHLKNNVSVLTNRDGHFHAASFLSIRRRHADTMPSVYHP